MEDNDDRNDNGYQINKIWWMKQIVLVILGGFYLYFGIHLLISSEHFSFFCLSIRGLLHNHFECAGLYFILLCCTADALHRLR